ncbi:MAG: ATP-binding protein [Acidobacteriota bacterium]|nr:ATP-binding protein [Acidobacteriota bacterium]
MSRESKSRIFRERPHAEEASSRDNLDIIGRAATSLSQESLVNRTLTFLFRFTGRAFDDRTGPLRQSPMGMFFYNQRALFFAFSGLFLVLLAAFAWAGSGGKKGVVVVAVLTGMWVFAGVTTLALHLRFTARLSTWQTVEPSSSFRRLFYPYFVLDSVCILVLIGVSDYFQLGLHFYALLLFANLVVYSACVATWKGTGLAHLTPFLLWFIMTVFMRSHLDSGAELKSSFHHMVDLGPQFGTTFVTLMAVLMISWLRQDEHRVTQQQLDFLGEAEDLLSSTLAAAGREPSQAPMEREFQARIRALLKALCSPGSPSWYTSGCFWFIERHEERGRVLIAGPAYKMEESLLRQAELPLPLGTSPSILTAPTITAGTECELVPRFLSGRTSGALALIPIVKDQCECGMLTLLGEGAPLGARATELVFLKTLGRIVADVMDQWDSRRRIGPQEEIDELFKCDALAEIFEKAATIIQRHLYASCCAVIFRPGTESSILKVVASRGFRVAIGGLELSSHGSIGVCASGGVTCRCDDFDAHRDSIADPQLALLEEQHRTGFLAWMLVPIGGKGKNFGVVLVANRRLKCPWFTEDDRLLAERLTVRLQALIEKFLHIETIEKAQYRAEQEARRANAQREVADLTARQRQDDLMVMTHQLQAPLYSVKFALEMLITETQARLMQERLEHIEATIEDSLALCYGTVTTFAQAAGRKASFGSSEIDALEELPRLCRRLQRTHYREDLRIDFKSDKSFPKLMMDRNVFTSVLYSLIQNAMKYATKGSYVGFECSFERNSGEAALKVKSRGEPILPEESERIFERYQRGAVITRTGRYHAGVGLGLWVARELMRAVGGNLTLELNRERPWLSVFVVHCPSQPLEEGMRDAVGRL